MSDEQDKKPRHSAHQTQWAAQFAVASELCKRGYEVAFTMGNHPLIDLMVNSPTGTRFNVDVKGLHKRNFWLVQAKEKRERLFYVLAFVPQGEQNRFFVLTQNQVDKGISIDLEHARDLRKAKGRPGEPSCMHGVQWKFAERFENAWEVLPK
jgi:hypothetical protein